MTSKAAIAVSTYLTGEVSDEKLRAERSHHSTSLNLAKSKGTRVILEEASKAADAEGDASLSADIDRLIEQHL
jgi:hypothetical protein